MSDARGGDIDNRSIPRVNEKAPEEEKVTLEDIQAMKQMIKEIRRNPDLLYDYSSAFRRHFDKGK